MFPVIIVFRVTFKYPSLYYSMLKEVESYFFMLGKIEKRAFKTWSLLYILTPIGVCPFNMDGIKRIFLALEPITW